MVGCFQEFLEETKKYYKAELQSVDFQHKAEEVRVEINNWVEKETQGESLTHTQAQKKITQLEFRVQRSKTGWRLAKAEDFTPVFSQ